MRAVVALSLLLAALTSAAPALQKDKAAPKAVDRKKLLSNPVPGYTLKRVEGFDVLVHDDVLKHNDDAEFKRKPLDVLELELGTVARVLPKRIEDRLKGVVVWVEWDDKSDPDYGTAVAKYYGTFGNRTLWAAEKNKHPGKANNVEIVSMKSLTKEHQPDVKLERCVILHELAHAVHFQAVGQHSPQVAATFHQAMDRKLYDTAKDVYEKEIQPYARTNEFEYFAEITCAYLDKLHYFPNTRDDLKKHDPTGYKLMEAVWGKAKDIDAAVKREAERAAGDRVLKARQLLGDRKKDEAVKLLERVVDQLPNTAGAKEAKKLLERHAPKDDEQSS